MTDNGHWRVFAASLIASRDCESIGAVTGEFVRNLVWDIYAQWKCVDCFQISALELEESLLSLRVDRPRAGAKTSQIGFHVFSAAAIGMVASAERDWGVRLAVHRLSDGRSD